MPRCGNSSLIIRPDSPRGWNRNGEPMQRAVVRLVGPQAERRDRLAVVPGQRRLVVERVDVREPAGQEDEIRFLAFGSWCVGRGREQAAAVLLGRRARASR